MRATSKVMFPALVLAAWLTAAGSCSSSSTGADAAAVTTGAAGKGSGGGAGTAGRGSGGTAGSTCGALCQAGQTCCYDRTGKVQCLPAGAVCTGLSGPAARKRPAP